MFLKGETRLVGSSVSSETPVQNVQKLLRLKSTFFSPVRLLDPTSVSFSGGAVEAGRGPGGSPVWDATQQPGESAA